MARRSVFCHGQTFRHSIYRVIFMIETVLGILIAILCVAGAVSLIKWVALKIANSGDDGKRVYAVLLDGEQADIRLQMMIETRDWDNVLQDTRAFAVDNGLSPEMSEFCKAICEKHRITYIPQEKYPLFSELFFE